MAKFGWFTLVTLTLAALLAMPGAARAAQDFENCKGFIASVPATINSAGTWCFNQNLSTAITSGAAITIAADNVTLDCNDFKLDGLAGGAAAFTTGIFASARSNVTVRRCNIRGFYYGILFGTDFASNGGHVIEDNRFDGNTYEGMVIEGDGSVVRRNRVFDTGGTTLTSSANAIKTTFSVDVLDNTIAGVTAATGGTATSIYSAGNSAGSISGNRVSGLSAPLGSANGIYAETSDRIVLRNNDLVGAASAGVGLTCTNSNGRARDNMIKAFGSGISGCGNDGGNVVKP